MPTYANPQQFRLKLGEWVRTALPEQLVALHKKITLQVLAENAKANPVGNPSLWKRPAPKGYVGGQSRGAWQVYHGGTGSPKVHETTKTGATASGKQIGGWVTGMKDLKPFGLLVVANYMPYIQRLEEGWSKQAPKYWILGNVRRVVRQFNKATK